MGETRDEEVVPTICDMCYASCGIKVRKLNGLVVDIDGQEGNPNSLGKVCAKGKAGIIGLYDPYRLKSPLRRTSKEKGIGVDPQWQEISWEEALEITAEKLKEIREDNPRRMVFAGLDFQDSLFWPLFKSAYGAGCRGMIPADYFCGNVLHLLHYLMEGAFFVEVDLELCNYCLLVGSQEGFMANKNPVRSALKMAEARARGMKLVVVDPVCSVAAAKADEWVPIRPGTDGALALGLLNVILNELGLYDTVYLREYTNGPYLVGPDRHYVREAATNKPLVWDLTDDRAKPYDSEGLKVSAIEGSYTANGLKCHPAFQLLMEHVKGYKVEEVSRITTIPAETIYRMAREFGEAARIGSTIVIEGKELPYRPAAVAWTRGAECHKHGGLTGLALQLLNVVVGAIDVPGGLLGNKTVDRVMDLSWAPKEGPDGLLVPGVNPITYLPYPARAVQRPQSIDLTELFPVAASTPVLVEEGVLNPEKYQLPYRPAGLVHTRSNFMMSTASPARMAEVLKKIPFMVSFARHLDETVEFSDIVFPDAHYLESFLPFPNFAIGFIGGPGFWYRAVAHRVVEPAFQARPAAEVFLELAARVGVIDDLYIMVNNLLKLKKPYQLQPGKKYSLEEIGEIWASSWFSPEQGLDRFKEKGFQLYQAKKLEEVYPRPFIKGRIPIYQEYFIRAGQDMERVTKELGLDWDTSDFQPLPDWKPCRAFEELSREDGFYAVNYRLPFHAFTPTIQNPWLCELGEYHPYAYKILINAGAAGRMGIEDGDEIVVESIAGKVKGRAKVSEGVHPEVVAIAGAFGHWCQGMPVARGKGVHFNALLPSTPDSVDFLSATLDGCVKVKVYRV